MNKKFLSIFLFSVLILLSSGCKKNPFDHRTKYLGDYDFTNSWSSWSMIGPSTASGVAYSVGRVEYGEDEMPEADKYS